MPHPAVPATWGCALITGVSTEAETLQNDTRRLRRAFILSVAFAGLLWAVKITEVLFHLDLVQYGVYPHQPTGLRGILLAPLIHGSFSHVFANTAPVIILGTALLYGYPKSAKIVLPVVYLGSGTGVWLFARSAYHIGASGLTFGMMFFIFTVGALRWDKRAIVLSMIVFFLYGSMIWGIFPMDPSISFESHFFGAVIGIVLAFILKNHDPLPPQKTYSWEHEADETAWQDSAEEDNERSAGPRGRGPDPQERRSPVWGRDTDRLQKDAPAGMAHTHRPGKGSDPAHSYSAPLSPGGQKYNVFR